MKATITKSIGSSVLTFEVEGKDELDALSKASAYTTIPEKCGLCQSTKLVLDSNHAKGFTFVKIKCLECNGRSNMGQLKEGGIFWKEFSAYEKPKDQ